MNQFIYRLLLSLMAIPAVAADDLFEIAELSTSGRVVTAHFADFDGDGRKDLVTATLDGIPPTEQRKLNFYLQDTGGRLATTANFAIDIPQWSAVWDVADLRDTPGDELLLLRPDGVTIVSVASGAAREWHIPVAGPSTVAASDDERGFDPLRMVYREFDDEPWILVPQIGALSIIRPDGTHVASLDIGRRANYFVAKSSGLLAFESPVQLFLDVPNYGVGDIDGDGLADIAAATRHEIRVFLRDPAGSFNEEPDYTLPIEMVSRRDHSRGSGTLITTFADADGDGRLDLMITHGEGSFTDAVTTTYVYRNHDGGWDLDAPDNVFPDEGSVGSTLFADIDSDGVQELINSRIRFSVLEVVELLLTRKVDAEFSIHRLQADGTYDAKPWSRRKVSTAISFETFRPRGFMPVLGPDLNNDDLTDFVISDDGKGIEVWLGGDKGPFTRRTARQKLASAGAIRFADFDGDDLSDFALYDPQTFDAPVIVGRNLGQLPD